MKCIKISLVIFLIFQYSTIIFGQSVSSNTRPKWLDNKPDDTCLNMYFIGKGYDNSLEDAKNIAKYNFMKQLAEKQPFTVEVYNKSKLKFENKTINGKEDFKQEFVSEGDLVTKYEKIKIVGIIEADFYYNKVDADEYEYYILFVKPTENNPNNIYKDHPFNIAWRSALVPGLGQFYNYEPVKGSMFIGGAALIAGSVIFCEAQRSDKMTKANQSFQSAHRKNYINKANTWESARNLSLAGLTVIYIWNIVDAATGKNNRFVGRTDKKIQYIASVNDHALQMGLKINFH